MGTAKNVEIDLFPSDLEFSVFTGEEIKRLSVVKCVTGLTFDPLGGPLPGGLYDSLMGNYGSIMEPCTTCFNILDCPGHLGHIELNALVYNPFFIKTVQRILSISCLRCFNIQMKDNVREIVILQLRLLDMGYIIEAQELELYKSEYVCASSDQFVKLEDGDQVHPRIAEMHQLLAGGSVNAKSNDTKTSCAIRSAIVNSALQRLTISKCMGCSQSLRNVRYMHRKLVFFMTIADLRSSMPDSVHTGGQNKVIFADECRRFLRQIYEKYPDLLKLLFPIMKGSSEKGIVNCCPVDLFFMDTIPVTPPKARPTNVVRDRIVEHPQTAIYRNIIETNAVLRVIMKHLKGQKDDLPKEAEDVFETAKGATPYEKLYNAWQALQTSVDLLLDSTLSRDGPTHQGLKQVLEKKEGLIRKHMMGKRVNYAARTVITPDPNINVEEVGIPDIFARKLSYPVPVTPWNVAELRKMVMNGPDVHPGANYIQDQKGYTTLIPGDNAAKRESMAKLLFNYPENGIKVVHRHILNGDVLLLNRQPSLHRPSIMAHKVRILPGEKTFRLHYSNCKAYNADFDGDEMNAHFPQSEVARAEAYNLVNVASNYLVPKDGTPLGGLIQDHVISGVKLTIRGRFFNREDYQQLVFQGLAQKTGDIQLLPPTILKPIVLWSGKQVLSTIIMNVTPEGLHGINLQTYAKISEKVWNAKGSREPICGRKTYATDMCESAVTIRNGQLLTGVLDKQQYGATTYGLIHCMYELYGGHISTQLLTAFTKVFTVFLQREGFTLGVQDILVTAEADQHRRSIIKESRQSGDSAVAAALDLEDIPPLDELSAKMEDAYNKDPKFRILLDRKYKSLLDGYTNAINKTCLPDGLISRFPDNNLQLMVLSGAKGSMVNTMQISCLLGQIELEGKRPPLMISGKSLPSFTSFETSPKSGGFIDGRFMTGIQPQDFFFHCMAGREGLIDTAVKTSRSGYLQRCLIKHLEGLTVNYDLTVRDSDNSVIQYLYGEDGLDVSKSKFFEKNKWQAFLAHNSGVILRPQELETIKDEEMLLKVTRHTKSIHKWQHLRNREDSKRSFISPFARFSSELRDRVEGTEKADKISKKTGRRHADESLVKMWKKLDDDMKELYRSKGIRQPDPTNAVFRQDNCYGAVSERLEKVIKKFRVRNPRAQHALPDIIYIKNMKALAAPGEPVGLLAAQSVGEPSTQMTLNTFHFAGRGEMNVTLGIPRLREILMLASSNIKTPSMDIPICEFQKRNAEKLRIKLNRVSLADVLQYVNVKIKLVLQPDRAYQYEIRFQFLPRVAYESDFCVKPKRVLKYMNEVFVKLLFRAIVKTSKNKFSLIDLSEGKTSKKAQDIENRAMDADDDNDEVNTAKQGKNKSATADDADNDADSSDDEQGNNDGDDATGTKQKSRKQDETEYDDPEEAEEINDAEEEDRDADEPVTPTIDANEDVEDDDMAVIVKNNEMVSEYVYDKEHYLWCKLTFNLSMRYKKPDISSIIRELATKSVVHQVQNIKRAIIYQGDDNTQLLKTDGINIVEMFKHNDVLNINKLYSNDIHAIARTYGIEAAAQVIVKEVTNVFRVYGIAVDRRHLSLIADYMTFDGTFQPLSRKGMEHSVSPLQQMSFESCLQFLKVAAASGRKDNLDSPSSRIMVGLPIRNGTGSFDLLAQVC